MRGGAGAHHFSGNENERDIKLEQVCKTKSECELNM